MIKTLRQVWVSRTKKNDTTREFLSLTEHPVYKDYYFTQDGRAFTVRELKPYKNKNGYLRISISSTKDKSKNRPVRKLGLIARLMWETFGGTIPEGYEINHLDKNRKHNACSNLECVTKKENLAHRDLHRLPPF